MPIDPRTAPAALLLAALRADAVDAHRRGAIEILAGYNAGELLDDAGIRTYIRPEGPDAAYVKWNDLGDALGAVNCPIDLSETAEAAVFLACAVAAGTPERRLQYGVKQWNDDNARAITRGFAIACGLDDPYDIIARIAELADAAIATGSAVGVSVGAVLANVVQHGTRITTPDQLREALGVAITDPDERAAVARTRPDLRTRLARTTMPWQDDAPPPFGTTSAAPTLDGPSTAAAGPDYATRGQRLTDAAALHGLGQQPAQRVDTQSPDVLDAAVLDIVTSSHLGAVGLPGILAALRVQTGSTPSAAAVTAALGRLRHAGRVTSSTNDTTTLYRLAAPAAAAPGGE